MLHILMLRPLVRPSIGLVGGVSVLLLQLAHEAIFLAPDLLKLVVGQLAPLFPGMAFEFLPLALEDVPVHLSLPPLSLSPSDLRRRSSHTDHLDDRLRSATT